MGDRRVSTSAVPPAPSKTWPAADVAVAEFRFHGLGADERAARLLLDHFAATGVRNIRAYLNGVSDDDLSQYLADAEHAHAQAELAAAGSRQRGDVLAVSGGVRRWPTLESHPGAWPVTSGGGRQ